MYLLAGLKYDRRVWREQWPRIMRHVVDACAAHGARLIFFDNVYAYGRVAGPMTEDTPVRPASRKGRVRAEIAGFLQDEMAAGRITAAIARAADFYGPYAEKSSVPAILVFERLAADVQPSPKPSSLFAPEESPLDNYAFRMRRGRSPRWLWLRPIMGRREP